MKEATGELNMTVITVVAIAAIAALFYAVVWPMIKENIRTSTQCATAYCTSCSGGTCTCSYRDENGTETSITCPDRSTKTGN